MPSIASRQMITASYPSLALPTIRSAFLTARRLPVKSDLAERHHARGEVRSRERAVDRERNGQVQTWPVGLQSADHIDIDVKGFSSDPDFLPAQPELYCLLLSIPMRFGAKPTLAGVTSA